MQRRSVIRLTATVGAVASLLVGALAIGASPVAAARATDPTNTLRLAFVNGFSPSQQEVFAVSTAVGADPPVQVTHVNEVLQLKWSPAGNLFAIQTVPF